MTFFVGARRVDAHGNLARCKNPEIALDTDTVFNTLAPGTGLRGVMHRKEGRS